MLFGLVGSQPESPDRSWLSRSLEGWISSHFPGYIDNWRLNRTYDKVISGTLLLLVASRLCDMLGTVVLGVEILSGAIAGLVLFNILYYHLLVASKPHCTSNPGVLSSSG